MINITSYLRSKNGTFVPVSECATAPPDVLYIEGAIELVVNGTTVIDKSMWDYVDQLWAYLVNIVGDFEEAGEAHTYFPDQPIGLAIKGLSEGRTLVTVQAGSARREATIETAELVPALKGAAIAFFQQMIRLVPQNRDSYQAAIEQASR